MRIIERAKYVAYRLPLVRQAMAPTYPYKVSPGQLAALVNLIDGSQASGGTVVEIGVAQGDTSLFLLEHLRGTRQERKVVFSDTFSGFTSDSINHEINVRGKSPFEYDAFRYGDPSRFKKNLNKQGHYGFEICVGDASSIDWSVYAPISAVLLDIDLYIPTLKVLNNIWEHLADDGGIVVDDCLPSTAWDGSLQAVEEFCTSRAVSWARVGSKGALILKRTG
jgi:O-methyltransferase